MPIALNAWKKGQRGRDHSTGVFLRLEKTHLSPVVVLGLFSKARDLNWNAKKICLDGSFRQLRFLPLEQLAISPPGGFPSTMEGKLLT